MASRPRTGTWQVRGICGMHYRGPDEVSRPSPGWAPATLVNRLRPAVLMLPAPEDWGDGDRVEALRGALSAALSEGAPDRLLVGAVRLSPGDPLDAALLRLAVDRLRLARQS